MLNVVQANPTDPLRPPATVEMVQEKDLGKWLLAHPAAVTVIVNTSVEVPFEPSSGVKLMHALIDEPKTLTRLFERAIDGFFKYRDALHAIARRERVRAGERAYEARVQTDREKEAA